MDSKTRNLVGQSLERAQAEYYRRATGNPHLIGPVLSTKPRMQTQKYRRKWKQKHRNSPQFWSLLNPKTRLLKKLEDNTATWLVNSRALEVHERSKR
jgi:hypothetical protein